MPGRPPTRVIWALLLLVAGDCRNRGTRFLLRDIASGLLRLRGKHPETKEERQKFYEKSGAHPLSCADACCEAKDHGTAELLSTLAQKQWQNGATERNRNRFRPPTHPTKQRAIRQSVSPLGMGAAGEFVQGNSGKQLNGGRRPQLALSVQAGSRVKQWRTRQDKMIRCLPRSNRN